MKECYPPTYDWSGDFYVINVGKYLSGAAVNMKKRQKEENRLKVQKAIDELDYKINDVARSLKTKKTYTIGVLAANIQRRRKRRRR